MNYVSVKATSLAYLVCPILTALLAFLLLKEPMKKVQWVALGMGVTGCMILAFGHLYDLVLAVLVGFSYALYLILQRKNKGYDMLLVLFVHILISVVGMTPYYFATAASAPVDTSFYLFVLAIAIFFTLVPMLLNLFALSGIRSGTVGMLMNINPIIAFSLSVFYFGEKADAMQYLGYGIIFGSVIVFNWKMGSREVGKSESRED
ncbi:EamA family transporter [Flavobacterium sp. N1718]